MSIVADLPLVDLIKLLADKSPETLALLALISVLFVVAAFIGILVMLIRLVTTRSSSNDKVFASFLGFAGDMTATTSKVSDALKMLAERAEKRDELSREWIESNEKIADKHAELLGNIRQRIDDGNAKGEARIAAFEPLVPIVTSLPDMLAVIRQELQTVVTNTQQVLDRLDEIVKDDK